MPRDATGAVRVPWPWAVFIVVLVAVGIWAYDLVWGSGDWKGPGLTVALVGGILAAVGVLATNVWAKD